MEYKYFYDVTEEEKITKKYLVQQIDSWYKKWYEEHMLESTLELTDKYATKVYDVLIDVNLMVGNYDMVKILVKERQKYMK